MSNHRNDRERAARMFLPNGMGGMPQGGAQMIGLELCPHGGPHAAPVSMNIPTGKGFELHVFGGYTKFEDAAIRIAAGLAAGPMEMRNERIAETAAELAEQVLLRCNSVVMQRINENKEKQDADDKPSE